MRFFFLLASFPGSSLSFSGGEQYNNIMYMYTVREKLKSLSITMYLNIPKITHGHGKGWDVIIDIQEVDPEAADCGSHLRPKTSLVISNHCQLHTQN